MPDQSATPPSWMIGAMIAVITTLASVVVYLFKRDARRSDKREKTSAEERKAMDAERAQWAIERETWEAEREKLRAEYESKHTKLSNDFAHALREEHKLSRDREDRVRAEFTAVLEDVAAQAASSNQALVEMLQKFYDRFVGSRTRY